MNIDKNIPTTNFPLKVKKTIEEIDKTYDDNEFLRNFQYIVKEYLVKSNNRGLLIYHTPGTGKSILTASISEYYRKEEPNRQIIILLSKSLESGMRGNIKKYMRSIKNNKDFIDRVLEEKYKFISLNASNMFQQVSKLKSTDEEELYNKKIGKLNKHLKVNSSNKKALENTLLIIDEFHNLSNSIKNKSKNAVQLYNMIMNTRNIKLIFLTGTPIINNPFELVPTYNLLKGYLYNNGIKTTLFPENMEEFNDFFIKREKNGKLDIKNKNKFQNRIFGLTTYYGDFYFGKKLKEGFPLQHPVKIEKVHMSIEQFGRYQEVRVIEKKEESNKYKKGSTIEGFTATDSKATSSSSYRIRSRQVSNYFIPEYALTFKKNRSSVIKHINEILVTDLKDLDTYSPKFKKIMENIQSYGNKLGVVYSEFVSGEGLALFSKVLEKKYNYINWFKSSKNAMLSLDDYDLKLENDEPLEHKKLQKNNEKTYAVISGDVHISDRQKILDVFNSKDNINGELIHLILLSKTGAEGLTLKNVRHLHIMEPFWNYARIEQIIARGSRFQSHFNLPKKEQTIQPYIYISIYPKGYVNPNPEKLLEKTTDQELLESSINNKIVIEKFLTSVIETSIDCSYHYENLEKDIQKKFKCRLCMPNNIPLYDVDIYRDIKLKDNCSPYDKKSKEKKVKVNEVKLFVGDVEKSFYYKQNPDNKTDITIYFYDNDLKGYIPMKKDFPYYGDIVAKILFK